MGNAKHRSVKFSAREMNEELPPELDLSTLKFVGRGPKAIEAASRRKVVTLDPDVAKVFESGEAVNKALRGLIQLAKQSARKGRKIA